MNATAELPEIKQTEAGLLDRAVLVSVHLGRFGNSRNVAKDAVEVDADKDRIRVTKQLIVSEEFEAVKKKDTEIRKYIGSISVPSFLEDGFHIISLDAVPQVNTKFEEIVKERKALVETATEAYPKRIEEAAIALRGIHDPNDYPSVEDFKDSFYFEWRFVTFATPDKLKDISPAIFEQEKERFAVMLEDAKANVVTLLRTQAANLVDHLVEVLTGSRANGKPKVIRDSAVDNINEFLKTFELRNIANDVELSEVLNKVRSLLNGVSPEALRTDESLKESVAKDFQEIQTAFDGMLEDRPRRKFAFRED